jgi:Gnt-I system high-affinity gluconate transporter
MRGRRRCRSVSMVLLIIASGRSSRCCWTPAPAGDQGLGVSAHPPILAAWSIAALLRLAVGSAVAAITAAGMVLPLIPGSGRPSCW